MASRLELQSKLEELLGTRNVYYQAPESIKMSYPAIRFNKSTLLIRHANDSIYSKLTRYEVIVISQTPDHPVLDSLLELPYCAFDRHYVSDNLNHDVFTLYY